MSSKEKNEMDILNDIINSQKQTESRTTTPPPKSKNTDEMTCEEKLALSMKQYEEQITVLKEKEQVLFLATEELNMLKEEIVYLNVELWGQDQDYKQLLEDYKRLESNYKNLQVNRLEKLYTDIERSDGLNNPNKKRRTGGRRKRKKTRNKRKKKQKKSRRK